MGVTSSQVSRGSNLSVVANVGAFERILHRDRLFFPGSKAADSLEILRWACRISDILTCSYDPDLDQGSDGWLNLLGVSHPV